MLETAGGNEDILKRYREIAGWVTGNKNAQIQESVLWFEGLCKSLNIQSLKSFGVQKSDFQSIIEKAGRSSSMKGNPVKLSEEDMARILELAY